MEFSTPKRNQQTNCKPLIIPPSPLMKKIGYGTGVAVYELQRSPAVNEFRSPWAIKKIMKGIGKENSVKRIVQEAAILRKLNHPNVVGFRGFVNNCLAMEECDSCLGDLIEEREWEKDGPFPGKLINKMGRDISKALNYIHNEALLIHCDVKSYNVLVKGDFNIFKLCDFGVSLSADKAGNALPGSRYVGTGPWCPPEVLQEDEIITTKADIYAFGLVIWEMLALMPPLNGTADSSIDTNESMLLLTEGKKERPALPNYEFGEEYKFILEVYFCCTKEDHLTRPSSNDLMYIFEEILKIEETE